MRRLKTPSPKTIKRSSWRTDRATGDAAARPIAGAVDAAIEPLADWALRMTARDIECGWDYEASSHLLSVYPLCCRSWNDHAGLHNSSRLPLLGYAFFMNACARSKLNPSDNRASWHDKRIPPSLSTLGHSASWFSEWFASSCADASGVLSKRGEGQTVWIERKTLSNKENLLLGKCSWTDVVRLMYARIVARIEERPRRFKKIVLLPHVHPLLPWEVVLWLTISRSVQHVMLSDDELSKALGVRCLAKECQQPMWLCHKGKAKGQSMWRARDNYWGALGVGQVHKSADARAKDNYCCESCCTSTMRGIHAQLYVQPDDCLEPDEKLNVDLPPRTRVVQAFAACLRRNCALEKRRIDRATGCNYSADIASQRTQSIVGINVDVVMLAIAASRVEMASYARVANHMPGGQPAWRSRLHRAWKQEQPSLEETLASWRLCIRKAVPFDHFVVSRTECDMCVRVAAKAFRAYARSIAHVRCP